MGKPCVLNTYTFYISRTKCENNNLVIEIKWKVLVGIFEMPIVIIVSDNTWMNIIISYFFGSNCDFIITLTLKTDLVRGGLQTLSFVETG